MLSPAESLGLSGATLEGRVRRAVHQVSDAVLQRIAERLQADALTHEVIYEHEGVRGGGAHHAAPAAGHAGAAELCASRLPAPSSRR